MGLQNTEWYFHIVVHNSSWNDYISNATALLERLREHGLTAGPKEVFFFLWPNRISNILVLFWVWTESNLFQIRLVL